MQARPSDVVRGTDAPRRAARAHSPWLALLFMIALAGAAAGEEIQPDRPEVTESARLVPREVQRSAVRYTDTWAVAVSSKVVPRQSASRRTSTKPASAASSSSSRGAA